MINQGRSKITCREEAEILTQPCDTELRFGEGHNVAKQLATIPVKIFGQSIYVKTHGIDNEIPMLLSGHTMTELGFVIAMKQKKVFTMGGAESILDSQTTHLVVYITTRIVIPEWNTKERQTVQKTGKMCLKQE